MKQSLTGIKRRLLHIRLCRRGFRGVRVGVDNHKLDLANAKTVASEVPNGVSVQQVFRMACNCGRAREGHLGDQQFSHRLGVAGERQSRQHYTMLREHFVQIAVSKPNKFLVGVGLDPGICHTLGITHRPSGFDRLAEGNRCRDKDEQKGRGRYDSRFWTKEHHHRQIYRSPNCENLDWVANLNRMRPSSNFKFPHDSVPTGRPAQLLVHGRCVR